MKSDLQLGIKERVLQLVVNHSTKVSFLLFIAAIVFHAAWPQLGRNVYFSENAMLVGSADSKFNYIPSSDELSSLGLEIHSTNLTIQAKYRAPRGNGKESILLAANDSPKNRKFMVSLVKHLMDVKWLHHDLILLLYRPGGEYNPDFFSSGIIREALYLDIASWNFDKIVVQTEGENGLLPNLDLVNVVSYYSLTFGLNVQYSERQFSVHPLYDILIGHFANQLGSVPTGKHSQLRKFNTHALTLKGVGTSGHESSNLNAIGKVLTQTCRCMNNLIEGLHQSYFLYFMISTGRFIGFDEFLPGLLILLGSIFLLINFKELKLSGDIVVMVCVIVLSRLIASSGIWLLYAPLFVVLFFVPVDKDAFQKYVKFCIHH